MITATWKTFLTCHPDKNELLKSESNIPTWLDPDKDVAYNTEKLISSPSTVALTLDPFHNLCTSFHHHRIGIAMPGIQPRLIALTNFGPQGIPQEFDPNTFFTETTTTIPTPSIQDYMSFHDKSIIALQTIKPSADNETKIRLTALLPPSFLSTFINSSSEDPTPWSTLLLAIRFVHSKKPLTIDTSEDETENDENEDTPTAKFAFATPYLPLLHTLWAFTRSTEETRTIPTIPRSVATDSRVTKWSEGVHAAAHINRPDNLPHPQLTDISSQRLVEGINSLSHSINQAQNSKFSTETDDEDNEKPLKKWKKLDPVRRNTILFASTKDGINPATEPTDQLLTLLQSNGPAASHILQAWHPDCFAITTGMASMITKGMIACTGSAFKINTFSPFFVPSNLIGPSGISPGDLLSLDIAESSGSINNDDRQKLTSSKPFIPSTLSHLQDQIDNYYHILCDILGKDSIVAMEVGDVAAHMRAHRSVYNDLFNEKEHFPARFLQAIHFHTQSIFRACATAPHVTDIPFSTFSLTSITSAASRHHIGFDTPKWYLATIQPPPKPSHKHNNTPPSSANGSSQNSNHQGNNNRRNITTNTSLPRDIGLKADENYSHLVNSTVREQCEHLAVKINGRDICNNWHLRGWCMTNCQRKESHTKLQGDNLAKYRTYAKKLREAASKLPADHFTSHPHRQKRRWNGESK